MDDNEDIKKQLEVKNKEIYRNKLTLDVDNNFEVLVLSLDNLLTTISSLAISKVIEINESFENKSQIEDYFKTFINLYRENLMNLLSLKQAFIKDNVISKEDALSIKNHLDTSYLSFKEQLETKSLADIKNLFKELKVYSDTNFKQERLNIYLQDIFLKNLNAKVLEFIKSRDIVLINTFKETHLKYLELNKNTVGA